MVSPRKGELFSCTFSLQRKRIFADAFKMQTFLHSLQFQKNVAFATMNIYHVFRAPKRETGEKIT